MTNKAIYKRGYFRIDVLLPMQANIISPDMSDKPQSRICEQKELRPGVVNISGGGISFKSITEFTVGDTLELFFTLSGMNPITVCVYGKVLKVVTTAESHYQIYVKFIIISDKIRDMIVSFVFLREREIMENNQLAAYDKFTDISVNRLVEETVLPFEVFANTDDGIIFLFDQGLPYDALVKEYLQEIGISRIYVKVDDVPLLDEYIEKTRIKTKRFDPADPIAFKDYSFRKRQFCSIDKRIFIPRTVINFSLFSHDEYNFSPFMETTPDLPLSVDEHIANLPAEILIKKTDIPLYGAYLLSLSSTGQVNGAEGLEGLILKEQAKVTMHDVYGGPLTREKIREVRSLVKRVTSFIEKGGNSFSALVSHNPGDLYQYVHAVNVAAMSIGVALTLNLSVQAIEDLAMGAILHDIGQSGINDEIINKQGKLVSAEYEVFKSHVTEGLGLLQHFENMPKEALYAVAHHHEKITGDGYPYRLAGNEISLFGRIVAIADAYDLLTTKRPYRVPQSPLQALTTLAKETAKYNPAILKVFIRNMSTSAK